MTHHKTWFPVIVVALSALLGLFIYSVYKDRLQAPESSPVTAAEYEASVAAIVGTLQADLAAASDNLARATLLNAKRDALLELLVPAEYKDLHLEMVMTLTVWSTGYMGDEAKRAAAELRWQKLYDAR